MNTEKNITKDYSVSPQISELYSVNIGQVPSILNFSNSYIWFLEEIVSSTFT